jgi:class 3 adenylate cyclase/CHASE2 domain-containing sensor protein
MTTTGVKRKLSAILSADVKGYSRLMGEDEISTVRTLKEYRIVITQLIQTHRGRVVDAIGDNLLAEFGSVVDAAQCAVAIQDELKGRNALLSDHRKMKFRIGINLGDVIEDDDRIYGDGINIAARMEGLAEPGGICISGSVYDQVKNKLEFNYDYTGDQNVKNIAESIRVYRITWDQEDVNRSKAKQFAKFLHLRKSKNPFFVNMVVTCLLVMICMPFVNYFNLNLLTKIWQCELTLLPNTQKVVVVTIEPDEHRKINIEKGQNKPPPYLTNPKMWRQYHPTIIKALFRLGAEAVGFDFWFPPAYDEPAQQATYKFAEGLKWSRQKKFPVVLGQAQNAQAPEIYREADWGYLSVYRDLTWIKNVMYLYSWDKVDIEGVMVEKTSLFVQVLAQKLRLTPRIEGRGVQLIGRAIPRRLWLAFSDTPFQKIPYHEVYNGWADKKTVSGKIVLIGLAMRGTDYFQVPYSPTDFTPGDKNDSVGMPGVFLFAHAINQIMNGYYYTEIHDEWSLFTGERWFSAPNLASLFFLLIETITMCFLLHGVQVLVRKKTGLKLTCFVMSLTAVVVVFVSAVSPVLIGVANLLCAAIFFIALAATRRPIAGN